MKKNHKKIPYFASTKAAADFWDTHDAGVLLDELDIVDGVYEPSDEAKTTMSIRVAPSLKKKIEEVAKSHDISTSSLIRMWMVDRLRQFAG